MLATFLMAATATKAMAAARPAPAGVKNGVGAYYLQLKRLVVNYCDYGGSSKHVRAYIVKDLIEFARQNPSIEVVVEQRRGRHPCLRGVYLNGNEKTIGIKNEPARTITQQVQLLRTTSGAPITKLRGHRFGATPPPHALWSPFDVLVRPVRA